MRFAAALFDLDDTLHDDTRAYLAAARAAAGDAARERPLDARRLYDAYVASADAFWSALSERSLQIPIARTRERLWGEALAACDVDDAALAARCADAYNRYRAGELALFPGVAEMLRRLRAAGLRLGIVTNGFAETHREKIERLALGNLVDGVYMADDVGFVKPDPRFFVHAARALGVEPSRCAVVGDRYDRDVRGAHGAGMYAIYFDVRGERPPPAERVPDAIVTRIVDAEPYLVAV